LAQLPLLGIGNASPPAAQLLPTGDLVMTRFSPTCTPFYRISGITELLNLNNLIKDDINAKMAMFWYRSRTLLLSFALIITLLNTRLFFHSDNLEQFPHIEEFPILPYEGRSSLLGCNAPSEELLPQTYNFHLSTVGNYTLDQHFQTINYNLTANIQHIDNTLWKSKLIYTASQISSSLLHQIRSDHHVDRVFCARNPDVPYQAPLHEPKDPEDRIEEEFAIALIPGHSMEDHSKAVGTNMSTYVHYHYTFDPERLWFYAKGIDDALLERIRGDEGVEFIERNCKVYLID
jgi:hypothetical protein